MTFRQFLLLLRARWRAVLSVFSAFVLGALALSFLMSNQYTATAAVVVDSKIDPLSPVLGIGQVFSSYLATQVDIISSERVAERVVKLLKLDEISNFRDDWKRATGGRGDFNAWLAGMLQKHVTVTPARESGVLTISVHWSNAKAAAAIANAFAQAYIDTTIDLKIEPAKQYAGWFDQRSKELRTDLEAKQKRLSDFQKESQITATDVRLDIENARLAELSTQLTAIQVLRQEAESRERRTQGDNEALPEVLQSPVIGSLKSNLALAQAKLENIAVNLGRNHPDYQNTEAEIASLKERIRQETAKVAASLGNLTQTNVQREREIRAALEAQRARVLALKHQHDELDVLQSDVTSAQHNLDTVTQRLAQSSLESQIQQTNVLLLTAATEPVRPSSPNIVLNVFLGAFFGILASVGLVMTKELADPRVRRFEEIGMLLAVPALGKVRAHRAGWPALARSRPAGLPFLRSST